MKLLAAFPINDPCYSHRMRNGYTVSKIKHEYYVGIIFF